MDMLHVVDAVAREKGIEKETVIIAMEEAIQKAGRSKYGYDRDIRVTIDRKTGDIQLFRYREVVEEVEQEACQLTLAEAQRIKPDAVMGEFLVDELPPLDFGRIAAQTAKQVIYQKVRDAERQRQFNEYKDRVGEIVNGVVKRIEYGNVTIDLGRAEAYMRRDEALPREHFKNGDRVRAYIYEVSEEQRGPQIFASRTRPEFMSCLFTQEVPEIYDGIIEIRSVARDPGSRAKIAVHTNDSSIDPVGACVGMRGSRVQAIVNELQGEKIDIIPWTEDTASLVISALAPAEVTKVVMDEENNRIDVAVPDEQLSLAIGRRGQNVRLASSLSGWNIDIMTEADESERRQKEFNDRSALFIEALDVDEVIAHLLVVEGFTNIQEIVGTAVSEVAAIEGFDEDVAEELINRAKTFLEAKEAEYQQRLSELKLADDLVNNEHLSADMLVKLGENDVKTQDDLADLAGDELVEILGEDLMNETRANEIIMEARAHWFADEDANDDEAEETAEKTA